MVGHLLSTQEIACKCTQMISYRVSYLMFEVLARLLSYRHDQRPGVGLCWMRRKREEIRFIHVEGEVVNTVVIVFSGFRLYVSHSSCGCRSYETAGGP